MKKTLFVLAGTALALSAQAGNGCVDVRLSASSPVLRGDVDVSVNVAVTNTCRHPVQVLSWQLPSDDGIDNAKFQIERDGQRVAYHGPIVKRAPAQDKDHIKLDAGATLNYTLELTSDYDLSQNGRYAVRYTAQGHGKSATLSSDTLYLWLEGRSAKLGSAAKAPDTGVTPAAGSISYTGRCSATQKTTLASAVTAATNYTVESTNYLSAMSGATPRYTTWFGAYSSANRATALDHFTKARNAFQTAALTLDCSCKKSGTFAYVYPNQPYKIYLCGAFWNGPMTGTDSKAGTLVHEMMHFTVIAGTDDWAYGQTNAKNLAISDPIKALNNSDNHEYFAENTPFQN
ncbi:peptidyl-Lys metalloendopeptidase [Inhella inkyongensis]|uniref:Peptidyl-Lys metalloendopeptidase n=1 Tax=Inhella inkyongensis TaxID=392593 RepID=A0A840S4E3_9BURK|nr:M35 family metallo-endopeptidase [Inhella inkyongensis]MBB5206157.1 peptidyl-Lys metalloendopeptidase [Inhella inkyongensis]